MREIFFQTMNSVRNIKSLHHQVAKIFELVAKTQFHYHIIFIYFLILIHKQFTRDPVLLNLGSILLNLPEFSSGILTQNLIPLIN